MGFAQPLEVLAYRIVWSIPLLAVLISMARQWPAVRGLDRRQLLWLALAACLLCVNWLTFIYAIHQQRIVETSLGYFINPLVSIVLGWLFLNERMRPLQWCAAAVAVIGVVSELVAHGELPWLGLSLAFSFGLYGLLRKQLMLPASVGLGVESMMLAPFALVYLVYLAIFSAETSRSVDQLALLALGGLVTILPLIWFASAAIRMPLTKLGFFQYLAPSISLVLAVYAYNEVVSAERWQSFGLIWLALLIFSAEGLYYRRLNLSGDKA